MALTPYSNTDHHPLVEFDVARKGEILSLSFRVSGEYAFRGPTAIGSRVTGLWEDTCFECFLANGSEQRYVEFNFSPAGDWQVFRFSDYRSGRRLDSNWAPHNFSHRQEKLSEHQFDFEMRFLAGAWPASPQLQAATIIRQPKEMLYYALSHGVRPDFHLRDHFRDGSDFGI